MEASRHQAREQALSLLYEAKVKGISLVKVVDNLPVAPQEYTAALIAACHEKATLAEALIAQHTENWAPERIAIVDHAILELGVVELLALAGASETGGCARRGGLSGGGDPGAGSASSARGQPVLDPVPAAVALNEAVNLANEYSTEASGAFVNGVLASIARSLGLIT